MEMGRKPMHQKWIYWTVSAVLFLVLFGLTFRWEGREDRQKVQVVAFGDSVLGLFRGEDGIAAQVGSLLDKTVYCAGFGGTCVGRLDRENRLDYGKDSLSLAALTRAVLMDDFGPQQTVFLKESATEYFEETVDGLARTDFDTVELVLIEHGLNDFYAGVPLRNEEDPMDEYTFAGALRSSLEALRKVNPDMRIVLVTPTYTWMLEGTYTCEEFDVGYGNQEAYVAEELRIAAEYGVEVIDVYHDFFPHEKWDDWKLYTMDGLHPNKEGRRLIAEKIADYLDGGGE